MNVFVVDHSRRYSGDEHWQDVLSEDMIIFSTVDAAQAHVEKIQSSGLDDGTWKWALANKPGVWYYRFTWDDDELNDLERDRVSAWIIMEVEVQS